MAFGNITTLYIPTAANAGASQWGTDVRKLLDSADASSDSTTITNHGTSGAVTRQFDPYTTKSADDTTDLFGWAITPTDMNSVTGALRFYPAGNHTVTVRMKHSSATGATGTLYMYAYRVASAASSRTRTLLGSSTASVSLPALAGEVTGTCTVALSEVVFQADETIQYSFKFNVTGVPISGETVTFYGGTQTAVVSKVATPKLGVLADTTGTATGTGAASGATALVLGTVGSSSGTGTATGAASSTAATTGTSAGTGSAAGVASSVAGAVGSASGSGTAAGLASVVLGTVGTASVGAGTPDWPVTTPSKTVAGTAVHHETGALLVGATIRLYRVSDNQYVQQTTTDGSGAWSFARDTSDPYTYRVTVDYDDSGTPIQGVTGVLTPA